MLSMELFVALACGAVAIPAVELLLLACAQGHMASPHKRRG